MLCKLRSRGDCRDLSRVPKGLLWPKKRRSLGRRKRRRPGRTRRMKLAVVKKKVIHHVSIARSHHIHTGDVGGDLRWYVDLATKRDMLRKYARGSVAT